MPRSADDSPQGPDPDAVSPGPGSAEHPAVEASTPDPTAEGMAYSRRPDPSGTILALGAHLAELTGLPMSPSVGNDETSYNDLIHPDDRSSVSDAIQRAVAEQRAYDLTYRVILPGRGEHRFRDRGTALIPPQDGTAILSGVVTDITEARGGQPGQTGRDTWLLALLERIDGAASLKAPDGTYLEANQRLEELLERARADLVGRRDGDFRSGAELAQVQQAERRVMRSGRSLRQLETLVSPSGRRHVLMTERLLLKRPGEEDRLLTVARQEPTPHPPRQQAERFGETGFRLLFEASDEAMALLDRRGLLLESNPAMQQLLAGGQTAPEPLTAWTDLSALSPDAPPWPGSTMATAIQRTLETGSHSLSLPMGHGSDAVIETPIRLDRIGSDGAVLLRVKRRDPRVGETERLSLLASSDSLTTLANRQAAMDWLNRHLQQARPEPLLLLALDLDRFQWINSTFGVERADLLLQHFARALRELIPPEHPIARLQGDAFLAMIRLPADDDAGHLSERSDGFIQQIREQLKERLERQSHVSATPTFCTGSSLYPIHGGSFYAATATTAADLMQEVNMALSEARRRGINNHGHYSPHLSERIQAKRELEVRLKTAIQQQAFALHYQPIVARDGRIVAAEALMRWPQPDGSFVPPDHFIPLAEANGQIRELGHWLIEGAASQLAQWRQRNLSLDYLSINVSPVQLRAGERSLLQQLLAALKRHDLPAGLLQLEITETAVLDSIEPTHAVLNELAEQGFGLALDDFGTGYSSLLSLRQLPLQALKIDKSFVQTMDSNRKSLALVEVCLAISEKLGLSCLAEGVETERQCQMLMKMGCDRYQGYLFDRALPAGQFEQRLARQQHRRLLSNPNG